jgi:class 3 adenylate cyclase
MRMGLHFGTPELTADGYVGMDVHRAARVMATAHGGQIVASAPLAVAIGDRSSGQATLVPIGYQTLKGIPEPEFLYRVVEAGLNP